MPCCPRACLAPLRRVRSAMPTKLDERLCSIPLAKEGGHVMLPPGYLDTRQAAFYVGVPVGSLSSAIRRGYGPPHLSNTCGRLIRIFRRRDLDKWKQARDKAFKKKYRQ